MIQSVDRYNFEKEVLKSRRTVLVNFWANGSEECHSMRKLMREFEQEDESTYKIVEINWNAEFELAHKYRVFGTPCLLIFQGGKLVNRYSGTFSVRDMLNQR